MTRFHAALPRRYFCTALFFFLCELIAPAQRQAELHGQILDKSSGKPLTGASISIEGTGLGTVSDSAGYYQLSFPSGKSRLIISYLGYGLLDTLLTEEPSGRLDFSLQPAPHQYEEVKVIGETQRDMLRETQMGEVYLRQKEIVRLPALLGEADPLRLLQLTPGVQSNTEGGMGFFVRGGGVDQNLVLLDNAVIYNPGHLLGFLSVFNPDMISEVSLSKAGIPARYGGRLSSVIRVSTVRGASDSLRVKGQVGLVSSRLAMYRSFNQARSSFSLSARHATIDLFIKPLVLPLMKKSSPYFSESDYSFYDLSGGLTHRLGKRDILSLSAFHGKDMYGLSRKSVRGKIGMDWGNNVVSARWNHRFNDSLNLTTILSHTAYQFELLGRQSNYTFGIASSILDYSFKSIINLQHGIHQLNSGVELTKHAFKPNEIDVNAGNILVDFLDFNKLYAMEGGLFAEDELTFQGPFSIAAGLRYSFFNQLGPYREYLYDEFSQLRDSILYPAGQSLAFYGHLEPRVSVRYQLNEVSSFKASWMQMAQYIHLATSATVSLPTDIWLPSSRTIRPQVGSQYSIGYFRKLWKNNYEASVELYYKDARNQLEFIRGVINSSLNMTLEENLAVGKGRSYGSEFFLRKAEGKFTGWISYTLGRTEKQFDRINEGKIYPAKYDRRHDLSLAGMYQASEFWNLSAVFVFVSGNAFTVPVGRYIIQGNLVNEYGEVNNYRMPSYHRLDLGATHTRITGRGNLSSWNFSVYNAYNRANPFYIYFEATGDLENYRLQVKPKLVSLFPIIPAVSWKFEF